MTTPKVPYGLSTVLGSSTAVSAFALAVVAFLTGDRSQQTLGTIAGAAVGGLALAVTAGGRYLQAHTGIKASAAVATAAHYAETSGLDARVADLVAAELAKVAKVPIFGGTGSYEGPAPVAVPSGSPAEVDTLGPDEEPPELAGQTLATPPPDVGQGPAAVPPKAGA